MKQILISFLMFLAVAMFYSCSKNYFQQTSLSPAFSKSTRYKIIVVKPTFVTMQTDKTNTASDRCLFHLRAELSKLNFDPIQSDKFDEYCVARSYGGNGIVSESISLEAAKSSGAMAIAFTEISTESLNGGLPLMATIRILNPTDGSQLYSGKARSDNPVSLEAGLEFAIEKALEGLK